MNTEHKYNKVKIFLDFLLLIAAFSASYFMKRGDVHFEDIYIKFLPLYFSCCVLSSIFTKKLKNNKSEKGYMKGLEPFFSSDPWNTSNFIKLTKQSKFVLTDSGGVQEENIYMNITCLTIKPTTERPVTIWEGTNKLIKVHEIMDEVQLILMGKRKT